MQTDVEWLTASAPGTELTLTIKKKKTRSRLFFFHSVLFSNATFLRVTKSFWNTHSQLLEAAAKEWAHLKTHLCSLCPCVPDRECRLFCVYDKRPLHKRASPLRVWASQSDTRSPVCASRRSAPPLHGINPCVALLEMIMNFIKRKRWKKHTRKTEITVAPRPFG